MYSEISEILLRRKNKLNLSGAKSETAINDADQNIKSMVVSIMKNVQALGYTFDTDILKILFGYSESDLKKFYSDIIPKLKRLVGADKKYNPMYPNFPKQVVEASDAELFINAIIHYWSYGTLLPDYEKEDRLPLLDDVKLTVLRLGTTKDIYEIFNNLLSSKTSISEQDKDDIETMLLTYPTLVNANSPKEIPLKENAAFFGKLIIEKSPIKNADIISRYFKTATDVLRLVTALSDGDISLATNTKYRKLRRCERRMIMDLLSNCGEIIEDMFRYEFEWIRIGEIIHPFEFKKGRYDKVRAAFNTLRNEKKPLFMPGAVQKAILDNNTKRAADLLVSRPGDFARQLDKLLRDSDYTTGMRILTQFANVANKVSVPVLLQVREHFNARVDSKNDKARVFFPKGNAAKVVSIDNNMPVIDARLTKKAKAVCDKALKEIFSEKESIGKVFIDDQFKKILVPFSQRSASSASKTIVRGSRFPIEDNAEYVRAFIWWTNMGTDIGHYSNGRVDLDLSAAFFDEDFKYIDHVSYTNLRSKDIMAYHSGDITNGGSVDGDGVAEFIDIDISRAANKARYVVFQVYSFTNQKFSTLPNARFGWMQRQKINSGEIFEPKTVEMSIDVNSASTKTLPVIFDCVKREFIWCDVNISLADRYISPNNLETNMSKIQAVCYAMTHLHKPNLYTLIGLNALARGEIVQSREEADIIFSNDTSQPVIDFNEAGNVKEIPIITAYDIDYIVGQLL
jgi:stress response protein SCP2